ncbi:type I DNA topoisomerase [Thermomicrobiaceae bacterium CFH 74404]|uniref:DNA topoisomerase 1 n=1 Tax=Thermalbibacter longus TaxID=2951981 RepID=A0AA41WBH7_9BACT|nr:type I DNA topoisomerase [Thermalbibacter longus]MCM8748687.1 type I DNA topoisomerase [Thermalbibacter longus]
MAKRTTKSTGTKKTSKRATQPAARRQSSSGGQATTGNGRSSGALVIVESPAKARTISRYLGQGFTVKASMGHVRDLPKSKLGVDVEHGFAPTYLILREKANVVKELKESVRKARTLILATDPDREGEAIAWHLIEATNAQDKPVRRIVFHEITPEAVKTALENPRDIDMRLVNAQQARRVLDRLVGYEISPLLWRKVKSGLSAGRVQSVALRLVVEREREIEAFVPEEYWTIEAELAKLSNGAGGPPTFTATLIRIRGEKPVLKDETAARTVVAELQAASFWVRSVTERQKQRRPSPPFTTSTLQQEASRKLRMPVRRTMQIAQELYEGIDLGPEGSQGLITYMRTDSTNVAAAAQARARDVIAARFGQEYLPEQPPVYSRKAKGAQEAHEAIRPTDPARDPESVKPYLSQPQYRLYKLIWERFIASQMRNAVYDTTTVDIAAGARPEDAPYLLRATGSIVRFPGFLVVYREGRDEETDDELDQRPLPPLEQGEALRLIELRPEQHFTQPPPRYTEASLVKTLEELGIGRPSTYAPTIETLKQRHYVTIEDRKLIPTELGRAVNDLLVEHFPDIVDVGFTSRMEEELDEIASGERDWVPVLQEFYGPFHQTVERAAELMPRVRIADEPTDEVCEKCGRPMVIRLGRYGRFLACTGFPECRNTRPLLEKIGVRCPACGSGEIVERRSRKGRTFYGCSRYPECDFVSWERPVAERCPQCGGYMVMSGRRQQSVLRCPACGHQVNLAETAAPDSIAGIVAEEEAAGRA